MAKTMVNPQTETVHAVRRNQAGVYTLCGISTAKWGEQEVGSKKVTCDICKEELGGESE